MKIINYVLFVASLVLCTLLFGCTKERTEVIETQGTPTSTSTSTNSFSNATNNVTVFGKVIDYQTRTGVGDATVYLKVAGVWQTSKTDATNDLSSSSSVVEDTIGDFSFSSVPQNSTLPLFVDGPSGYVQAPLEFTTPTANAINSPINYDLGQVKIEKGVTVTLYVKDSVTDRFISSNSAIPIFWSRGTYSGTDAQADGRSMLDVRATQDTTDENKYTLTIPQSGTTTIAVNGFDTDDDGTFDYSETAIVVAPLTEGTPLTRTIRMAPVTTATVTYTFTVEDAVSGASIKQLNSAGSKVAIPIYRTFSGGGVVYASQSSSNSDQYTLEIPESSSATDVVVPELDLDVDGDVDYLTTTVTLIPVRGGAQRTITIPLISISTSTSTVSLTVKDVATTSVISRENSSGGFLEIPIYKTVTGGGLIYAVLDPSDNNKYTLTLPQVDANVTITAPDLDTDGDGDTDYTETSITVNPVNETTEFSKDINMTAVVPKPIQKGGLSSDQAGTIIALQFVDTISGQFITSKDETGEPVPLPLYHQGGNNSLFTTTLDGNKHLVFFAEGAAVGNKIPVFIPAFDFNNDGLADFQTLFFEIISGHTELRAKNVDLLPLDNTTSLSLLSENFTGNESGFPSTIFSGDRRISFLFNSPVFVDDESNIQLFSETPFSGRENHPVNYLLTHNNTLLTIFPAVPLSEHIEYFIDCTIISESDQKTYSLQSLLLMQKNGGGRLILNK